MSAMKHKFCTAFAKSVHVFCVSLTHSGTCCSNLSRICKLVFYWKVVH